MIVVIVVVALAVLALIGLLFEGISRSIVDLWGEPRWMKDLVVQQKDTQMALIGQNKIDVAFTGSSVMMCAIAPESSDATSGLKTYNAALFRGCPTFMEVWTTDILIPRLAPKIVVMELFPLTGNDNTWMFLEVSRHANSKWKKSDDKARRRYDRGTRFASWRMLDMRKKDWREALTKLKNKKQLIKVSRPTHALGVMGPGGDCIEYDKPGAKSAPNVAGAIVRHMDNFESQGREWQGLRDNVRDIRATGALVLWLEPPVTQDLIDNNYPGGRKAWVKENNEIRKLGEELDIEWLEAPVELDDDVDFADFIHLAGSGKHKWSRAVGEALKAHPAVQAHLKK